LSGCPFCTPEPDNVLHRDEFVTIVRDRFPVSPGHVLVITNRHIQRLQQTTREEQMALLKGLQRACELAETSINPDGYNIGINDGSAAGQTIQHLHVHLIPRFSGDVEDHRGGIRWVLPTGQNIGSCPHACGVTPT
jgi:diadenosine tetraphosphate (Ap4A) HIT family hydrolase